MVKDFILRFKDDRKYFTIVFFILLLIFLTGIISPILIERKKDNWPFELNSSILTIEESVNELISTKSAKLILLKNELREDLKQVLGQGSESFADLIALVNNELYSNYSVQVIAPNGKMIAWNSRIAVPESEILPFRYPHGETHFYSTEIITYLSVNDTLSADNDLFYFIVSLPFQKHYSLSSSSFENIGFIEQLNDRFMTEFEIAFNPFSQKTKDGRKHSFEILNNSGNKIGLVTFVKPALNTSVNRFSENTATVQSVLACIAIVFAALGFRREFKELKSRTLKLIMLVIYAALFRSVIFFVGFPANIIKGPLTDSAYFASTFALGIVKSPLEFLVTNIFLMLIAVTSFAYLNDYLKNRKIKSVSAYNPLGLLILPGLAYMFFATIRGLNASIKSVIFDSSLRYFREPDLIPDLPVMIMHFNVLLIGTAVILILVCYLLASFALLPAYNKRKFRVYVFSLMLFYLVGIVVYLLTQNEPLIGVELGLFFTLLLFIASYQVFRTSINSPYNYVYGTLIASIISVTLLNYFNLELEKQSLKTTAYEINRSNENLLRFLLDETIRSAVRNEKVYTGYARRNTNYDALAFVIWSNSSLQRESMGSSVYIFGRNKELLGLFGVGENNDQFPRDIVSGFRGNESKIYEYKSSESDPHKVFFGIAPVTDRGFVLGYIAAGIRYDLNNLGNGEVPGFLSSSGNFINNVIDLNQIRIFEILNSKPVRVFGDVYPSRDQIEPIISAGYSVDNEARLNVSVNNENYLVFALKQIADGEELITAVLLKEKQVTWNLFNFFKVFLIHSIFIALLYIIIFFSRINQFRYTFRSQLLIAFLLVSIIPVIVLAVYNRQEVKERTQSAIFNELNERTQYIENHVRTQLSKHKDRDFLRAFDNAARELGISFSVYDDTRQLYSSDMYYFTAGLFNSKLSSVAHYNINYLNYREFLTTERVESFPYNAFYKKVSINDQEYIIGVNDVFNKINITLSTLDVDVFLFGVYSFAVIVIILVSTFLANRISAPIRRLTNATRSVAQGDLSVTINISERGEMRDLVKGFNMMTRELEKNQVEIAELERENAWKEMAKQVAHEIKNPLTPMKLAVQQLVASFKDKSKSFENTFEKVSQTLLNQIETLNQIASEFSRFARMPSFKSEEVDLVTVTNDTVNLFQDENIRISLIASPDSAIFEGDASQFRRLLINLIRNSMQASATEIRISITSDEDSYLMELEDNGNGIPDNIKDRIFEPSFTTKDKGMGLGLKLAKRFLEGINGNISLKKSTPGGTIFRIRLPKTSLRNQGK